MPFSMIASIWILVNMSFMQLFFFLGRSPPRIREVSIPEDPVLKFASALRNEINRAFATLRDSASGRDLKKFLSVCLFSPFGLYSVTY